jgi:hypothetical protein
MRGACRSGSMSPSDVEWLPGNPRREWTLLVVNYAMFGYAIASFVVVGLALRGVISLPSLAVVGLALGIFGLAVALLVVMWLGRSRPGFHRLGISREGLLIRYPLQTRTFPWAELVWYPDRMRVEGRSGWSGPPLMALTAAQFQRIQRMFYPQ